MRDAFKRFLMREDAAVTTDYVPLIAVAIGLAVAVIGAVFSGARTAGENVGEATRTVEVSGQLASGGGDSSGSASAGHGGSGGASGGAGSFVPGQGGNTGCQGVPGVSCSGLGDGSNPGAGSGNNNAGGTPGGSGVSNPGGGGGNSGNGSGNSGGGSGNSGNGSDNSGNGSGNSGNGNGNSGGGNSGGSNPGQGGGNGQGNGPGNSGGAGGNNGQGGSAAAPPAQGGGQSGGNEDMSGIPANPDFVIPAHTLDEGWAETVTSNWLTFGENGALPGEGPVGFTVSGDGNAVLQTDDGHRSEGQISPWGTNIVMETPPCGKTATVVINLDTGQTGIWEVSRPPWPAAWGTPPAGC